MAASQVKGFVIFVAAIALIFFLATVPASAQEMDGRVIRAITVNNQNVFDSSDENENGIFYKSANYLHIKTRNNLIRSQLLFSEGDTYSEREAEESERILRSNKYIRDAHIIAFRQGNDVVINVTTSDTWSTKPTFSFGRVGGKNKSEIGLEEENLFGRGINLGISYRKDFDRTSTNLRFVDKHFLNSQNRLELQHSIFSDGQLNLLSLEKPFYALDSQYSYGMTVREEDKSESLYFQGDSYFTWGQQEKEADIYWGWSKGLQDENVLRHNIGLHSYEKYTQSATAQPDENFELPEKRVEVYPYYSFEYLQNRYDTTINQDKIARTEDRYLGTQLGMQIGYVGKAFGSDSDLLRLEAYAAEHKKLSAKLFAVAGFNFDFEYSPQDTLFSNARLDYYARLYFEQTRNFRFYADITGVEGYKLRFDRQIFLDDEMGFRGYPLRYLSGNSAQKLTLEQRYFCDNDLWRIFNFGAAVFMDIGRISGGTAFDLTQEQEKEQNGIYKTIGIGLRITSNRSSRGDIVHIDLSSPLDAPGDLSNLQLTISSKTKF